MLVATRRTAEPVVSDSASIEASRERLAELRGDADEDISEEELLARLEQSRNEINAAIRALKARTR